VLACLGVYLTYQVLSVLVHQVLLSETYGALAAVFRPEAELVSKAWIGLLTSAVTVILFCYLFTRLEKRPRPLAGLGYGALVGALVGVSVSYETYAIYPIPLSLANAWFASSLVVTGICGLVLASIYRGAPEAA
jgi:ABC-type enterochelin transport system permease subunit